MNNILNINKKSLAIGILLASLLVGLLITQAQAAANDSSITLKKDPATGLFILTVKDPDGIQEFSMAPAGKSSYGGGLNGCPTTFSINNVLMVDPLDFEPVMPAFVTDCRNNTADLEIAPPKDGLARSVSLVKEVAPPAPKPLPKEEPKEVKKEGPLSAGDVVYPVKELGDCQNETECRSYCDNSQHAKECLAFAKKYNLITEKEFEEVKEKFLSVNNGPGGCNSGSSCEVYCNNVDHIDECVAFAEKSGYYSGDELAEAKKFQELVKAGKQFPGGCKDRNSCELYCNDSRHMEECLNFAEESGFMPKEEIEQARKILPLMQRGETPGGCTSKEQCEKYCFEENHTEECITFGQKAGLISAEDAAMIKKTGGKGPGGCRSKEQCESYCANNSEECFKWSQDNGFISEADLAKMKQGLSQFKDQLEKMPPEVTQCLKDAVGDKNFEKLVSGQPVFDRSLEGKMKSCFSQLTSQVSQQLNTLPPEASECIKNTIGEEGLRKLQSGAFDENIDFSSLEECFQQLHSSFGGDAGGPGSPGGPGGFSGPGGCKSIGECTDYCQTNPNECQQFAPPGGDDSFPGGGATGGQFPGGGATGGQFPGGPGGCTSAEECAAYCQYHPQECGGGPSDGGGRNTSGNSQSCIQPPSGLVASWTGDSLSGVNGRVTVVDGKVGKTFQFDGSSGYLNLGNPENLNFGTGPFSLETWFKWDGGGSSVNNIIRKSNYPSSGPGSGYWLRIGRDSQIIEFAIGATTGPEGQSMITAPITAGIWHHATATRDNSDAIKLYIDGQSTGQIIRQASKAESTSESPFTLGAWADQRSEFFSGLIDEIAVYNRALEASEIKSIFNADNSGKCSGSSQQQQQQQYPTTAPANYPTTSEEYCKQYPEKCQAPPSSYTPPPADYNTYPTSGTYTPPPEDSNIYPTSPEEYCKQYPEKCQTPPPSSATSNESFFGSVMNLVLGMLL